MEALACRLAAVMSMAHQASFERYQAAIQTYALSLSQAKLQDVREANRPIRQDGPWMEARR